MASVNSSSNSSQNSSQNTAYSQNTSQNAAQNTGQTAGQSTSQSLASSYIPEYSQAPLLQDISQYSRDLAPQVYQWGMDQFSRNQGNIDGLMQDALSYASPQRTKADMGMAESGVQQGAEAGRKSAIADLQSYGIDPSSGRYQALDNASRVTGAASAAGAGNQQRISDQATGNAMRNQAMSQYMQNTQLGYGAGTGANALLGTASQLKYPPLGNQSLSASQQSSGGYTQGTSAGSSQGTSASQGSSQGSSAGSSMGSSTNPPPSQAQPKDESGGGGGSKGGSSPSSGGKSPSSNQQQNQPNQSYDPYDPNGPNGPTSDDFGGSSFYDPYGVSEGGIGWPGAFDPTGEFTGTGDLTGYGSDSSGNLYGTTTADSADWSNPITYGGDNFDSGGGDYGGGGDYSGGGGDYGGGGGGDGGGGGGEARGGSIGYLPGDYPGPANYQTGGAVPMRNNFQPGGGVPPAMSPSRGAKTDDIPANLNAGEFVIPKDVAAWKGQEFFYKLMSQARRTRATAGSGAPPPAPPSGYGAGQ